MACPGNVEPGALARVLRLGKAVWEEFRNVRNVKETQSLTIASPHNTFYFTCSNICVPLSSLTFLPVEVITDPLVLFEATLLSERPRRPTTP